MAFVFPLVSVTFDLRNIVCCLHFSKLLRSIISFPLEINFPPHYWIDQVCQKMSALTKKDRSDCCTRWGSPKRQPNSNYTEYRLSRRIAASILLKEASASSNTKRLRKNEKPSIRPGVVASRKCSSNNQLHSLTACVSPCSHSLSHSVSVHANTHNGALIIQTMTLCVAKTSPLRELCPMFFLSRGWCGWGKPHNTFKLASKRNRTRRRARENFPTMQRGERREEREGKSLPRGSDKWARAWQP